MIGFVRDLLFVEETRDLVAQFHDQIGLPPLDGHHQLLG
jgi:hypothetical protein